MWVEFVVGFLPCSDGLSPGPLVFLPPQNQRFKFQLDPETVNKKSYLVKRPLLNSIYFIYFISISVCYAILVLSILEISPHFG